MKDNSELTTYKCACPEGRCLAVESLFSNGQLAAFPVAECTNEGAAHPGSPIQNITCAAIVVQDGCTYLVATGHGPDTGKGKHFEARCKHQ